MKFSFPIPFVSEIRTIIADRVDLLKKIYRDFPKIVDYFVRVSDNLFCVICQYEHSSENNLRNCLQYHKVLVANYFIDHELIEGNKK